MTTTETNENNKRTILKSYRFANLINIIQPAIEAADIVLMDDNPLKIAQAIRISRKCMRIVYENIIFALGVKGICLILGAVGIANMWLAIFADVGVMVIAVLNAVRCLHVKE